MLYKPSEVIPHHTPLLAEVHVRSADVGMKYFTIIVQKHAKLAVRQVSRHREAGV